MLAIEAVIAASDTRARMQAGRQWAGFIVVAALLALVTPNGIETYLLPWRLLNMHFATSVLIEWQSPDFSTFQPLEIWLIGALLAAAGMGLRLPWTRALMIALLIHFALTHARNGELLGFGAPLLAARAIAAQLGGRLQPVDLRAAAATSANPAGRLLAGAAVLAIALIAAAFPLQPRDGYMPVAAVQAVKDRGIEGPVLNAFSFGGYLIFSGIPTFIDGRADMFGDVFFEREHRAVTLQSDELPKLLEEYRIAWTIFPPQSRAAGALDRLPGWQRFYTDDVAAVHIRTAAAPKPPR